MTNTSVIYSELKKDIISINNLLSKPNLRIPHYQRPYKWTSKHINQLLTDIAVHKDKTAYRLGTIVFHQEGGEEYIVDGQQRIISLLLITHALINLRKDKLAGNRLKNQLDELNKILANINHEFDSEISKTNIHNNYLEISRQISRSDFTEELIDFLLNRCEVVTFTLNDISEAFQFFDSQNARGRDLDPHDLLKAYHLREFGTGEEVLKARTVEYWESRKSAELANLFSEYLYRIRNWSKGASARYFEKDDVYLFKGVNMETAGSYPYVGQLRIAHHFVDDYNRQFERRIDHQTISFPFNLDQIIINGRRFFDMISHYQSQVSKVTDIDKHLPELLGGKALDGFALNIIKTINSYEGKNRTGDRYIRSLFDCLLIYYLDKFGTVEISRAIEKAFIWAYSLRLNMQAVHLASMDNHVLENNLFKLIKDAIRPTDFINYPLPMLSKYSSTKTEEVVRLFEEMKYL